MTRIRPLTLLLSTLLLGACASNPPPPPRLEVRGFSILQPKEKEWVIAQRTPDRFIIGRPGAFTGTTVSVQAVVVKLPALASADELMQHVKVALRKDMDPKRFRIRVHEVSAHAAGGEPCALSHMEAVERSPANATGPAVNVVLESLTLICAHPKDKTLGINLTYSHRSYPEDQDPQFLEKGTLILDSLEFADL